MLNIINEANYSLDNMSQIRFSDPGIASTSYEYRCRAKAYFMVNEMGHVAK